MEYRIAANVDPKRIVPSTLRLGGENPAGDRIGFTNYYMEINDRPYFAVCGEFHYSRYPEADWETEIRKMKMSGINTVATYIFWNHHEEAEGVFDWRGNRNLRRFVELCGEIGLYAILRIGPFCHGEVRNGGLPDWLFGRAFEVRSNDAEYLARVARLYGEIGRQAAGLLYKDGGPVIGIQLENEFNAAAALWELTAKQGDEYLSGGSGGVEHMRRLKRLAVEAGLVAPIYTSTGWGGAPCLEDEVLPLYGGYAYTPWSVTAQNPAQKPTREYVFVDYHNDHAATPDFEPPYPKSKYPFACCEMGGGMQAWYLSRFQVEPESVLAMSLMKIAGGCNFVGYYMFHGGTNPVGRAGYLNESTTPRITYDFQAPIGEFGQIRASNDLLRPLHYFLQRFGERLAPLATVLPPGADAIRPEDAGKLRHAVRTDGRAGFVFINNYQDHVKMKAHEDVRFAIGLREETLRFPMRTALTVAPGASMMLPFHFDLDGTDLRYATAEPVTATESAEAAAFFFRMPRGVNGEFAFAGRGVTGIEADGAAVEQAEDGWLAIVPHRRSTLIRIRRRNGKELRVYAMSADEAAAMWVAETGDGGRRVLFSDVPVVAAGDRLDFLSIGRNRFSFSEYAGGERSGVGWEPADRESTVAGKDDGLFRRYRVECPERTAEPAIERRHDRKVVIRLDPALLDRAEDVHLTIDYTGNVGYAFSGGRLFHDHFYNGLPWEIGLKRFRDEMKDGEIVLETTPLRKGTVTVAADAPMAMARSFDGEAIAAFHAIKAEPIYRVSCRLAAGRVGHGQI